MGSVLRSLAFYAAFYGGSVVLVLISMVALLLGGGSFRAIATGWSVFHRRCVELILGIKVVEEGRKPQGAVLCAFKHESFFEAIDLASSLPDPVVFAKEELFRIPGWGRAARAHGAIPVARNDGAGALRAMIREARIQAKKGRQLAIFPEGTRIPHGEKAELRSGFAGLYKMLGLPVIPVAVNSGPLYHRRWKQRGTITIRYGEPIPPGLPREEVEQRVLAAINALND